MEYKLCTKKNKSKNFSANTSILKDSLNLEKNKNLFYSNSKKKLKTDDHIQFRMLKNVEEMKEKNLNNKIKLSAPIKNSSQNQKYFKSPRNRSSSINRKFSEIETQIKTETFSSSQITKDESNNLIKDDKLLHKFKSELSMNKYYTHEKKNSQNFGNKMNCQVNKRKDSGIYNFPINFY